MPSALVDTGVWYAIFDPRDRINDRENVEALAELLETMTVVVPWPVTFETVRTRFARNVQAMAAFERQLRSHRTVLLEDAPYREDALNHCFDSSLRMRRPLSLLDSLLRVVISDPNTRIDFLATYNNADFHDVCAARRVELLPG